MRVPVRRLPQTRVSDQQRGFARAVPGLDLSAISRGSSSLVEAAEGFRKQLQSEQLARQRFDANKRLMQEVNDLQADFVARQRDPEISPVDFADITESAYQERHRAILEELRDQDFDEDVIQELDLKLGSVRQGFYAKGLEHQIGVLRTRALEGANDLGISASQYVAANPDGYGSAKDMIRESVSQLPDLTEEEKEGKINELLGILRDSGAKSMAIQNPQLIIDLFDPQGLTAPYRAPTSGGSGGAINIQNLDADRSAVASTLSAGGLSAPVVAGFLGNFDVEGGYGGALGDNGTASGIAQLRGERRDNFKRQFGKEPHQASKEEQAQFVLWELANPRAAGMTEAQVAAIKSAETAEDAAELIDKFYERSDGKHRSRRKTAAAAYVVETPPSAETEPTAASALAPPISSIAGAKTDNDLLDDLNGPERLQLLSWAREQLNKVSASRKAEMDVTIGNITAEALNNGGEIATPLPSQADVLSVYGPVEGPQRWAQIQQSKDTGKAIQTFRTRSATDIQLSLDAIRPRPGSPTYETELQIYQSAERAASQLLQERQSDPAAYAMKYFPSIGDAAKRGTSQYYAELDRVYETLGIDSNRAPLLSSEATKQIVDDYKLMSPAQKLQFHRENFAGMGEDRFRRFVSNMEGTTAQDDARIFALLKTYPGAPGEVANVYQQVLEGREIMAQDPARRPSAEAVNLKFRAEGLSAIANLNADASRAIQETAAALYVARGGDPKDIKTDLYREALRTALGGSLPVNMRRGQVKDYTILPPRVTEPAFRNWAERQTFESLTALSVEKRPPRYGDLKTLVQTEDLVDEGVFVMVSPGRYMIKMASDGRPVMTSTGRPFLVNIHARDVAR